MAPNPYMQFCATYRSSSEWVSKGYDRLPVPDQGKVLGQLYRSGCKGGEAPNKKKESSYNQVGTDVRKCEAYFRAATKKKTPSDKKRKLTFEGFKNWVASLPTWMTGGKKLPRKKMALLVVALGALYYKSDKLFNGFKDMSKIEDPDSSRFSKLYDKMKALFGKGDKLPANDAVPEKVVEMSERLDKRMHAILAAFSLLGGAKMLALMFSSGKKEKNNEVPIDATPPSNQYPPLDVADLNLDY